MEYCTPSGFKYDEQDMEDIVVTAFEGAIGYWACLDNTGAEWDAQDDDSATSEWMWKLLKEGEEIRFLDEEDNNEVYFLTLDKLLDGIDKTISNTAWDGDMDDLDMLVADVIFQYAMLGDVVYA